MARRPDPHSRAALVDAARLEFQRRGLHGARIEDITQACGLAKGSFYLHFASKEALFAELVKQFEKEMDGLYRARRKMTETLLADGPLTPKDIAKVSRRYRAMRDAQASEDLRALELMWAHRDIVEVLISGSQGTPFEGTLWKLVEREAARVAEELHLQQAQGTCRTDVPPEIFGAMMVGTYLMLARRMGSAKEKPDLAAWAGALQALVMQGSREDVREPAFPALSPAATPPARAARKPAGRTSARSQP